MDGTLRQSAQSNWRLHGRDNLCNPRAGYSAVARGAITQFVAGCFCNGLDPDHDVAAIGAVENLADLLRQRRWCHLRLRSRFESAGLEDRHIVLAGDLHVTSEQTQLFDNSCALLVLLGDDFLASIESPEHDHDTAHLNHDGPDHDLDPADRSHGGPDHDLSAADRNQDGPETIIIRQM